MFKLKDYYSFLDSIELARMLYHSTSVSCNPAQFFGLTTANQLAPALGENKVFNDENLRAVFLTALEKGTMHESP